MPFLAFWRTMYYIPAVLAGVAVAIVWSLIFNPRYGIVNWALSLVGIDGPGWIASPDWALPALIIMSLWSVGGGMIIYLAGLQSIPTTLYEAAELDGEAHREDEIVLELGLGVHSIPQQVERELGLVDVVLHVDPQRELVAERQRHSTSDDGAEVGPAVDTGGIRLELIPHFAAPRDHRQTPGEMPAGL